MYDNKTHKVKDRIVSISQPYIRPIVRGKAKAPVEFGAKLDMSIDEKGIARLEKLSFDAYNEEDVLVTAIENYRKRRAERSGSPARLWGDPKRIPHWKKRKLHIRITRIVLKSREGSV